MSFLRTNLKTSRRYLALLIVLTGLLGSAQGLAADKVHLFILSGQSNMAGLNPAASFTPAVTKALAPDKVIVVKSAQGGQPIRRWYKQWKPAKGRPVAGKPPYGDLYDRMMDKVRPAIEGKTPATVTFVWMQGERDAKEMHGEVYAASMRGLIRQLRTDMNRQDVNVVIGRLSDCLNGKNHWDEVRAAQVEVAKTDPRVAWVDTDDLNGPKNGLHYNKEGYVELGKRFAESSLTLLRPQPLSLRPRPTKWLPRHAEKLAEIKRAGRIDLVFIGDSIMHCWDQEGKPVWDKYYKDRNAMNLGFGGDMTEQVIWRLGNGEADGYKAKLAVVMIGTNNSRRDSPADIAAGIRGILDEWRRRQPQAKVLLLGIFPRGGTPDDPRRRVNEQVNVLIRKFADDKCVFYMDIGGKFLTGAGILTKEIMPDLLHPSAKGYGIWAEAIDPAVKKLLGQQ